MSFSSSHYPVRGVLSALLAIPLTICLGCDDRGYERRDYGVDMNRDGAIDAKMERNVCDGSGGFINQGARDVDGDAVAENEIYVACPWDSQHPTGIDNTQCGTSSRPCRTINYALNARAPAVAGQDIVCFRGTCATEPENMSFGPSGISSPSGFWLPPAKECNNSPYYSRPLKTNESEPLFKYACNPTMLMGWDSNRNDIYPPADTADKALIDGAGKRQLFNGDLGGAPSYYEMAHFSVKDYGKMCRKDAAGNRVRCGFFRAGTPVSGYSEAIAMHDIELVDLDREAQTIDADALVIDVFGAKVRNFSIENVSCHNCGGWFLRGQVVDLQTSLTAGPIRLENLTWTARGGTEYGTEAMAVKLFGRINHIEILNSIFDNNLSSWTPNSRASSSQVAISDYMTKVDVINNEFIDPLTYGLRVLHPVDPASGPGNVDRINILSNRFRATHDAPSRIFGGTFTAIDTSVVNATIANNFFSIAGSARFWDAIESAATSSYILNNTIDGNFSRPEVVTATGNTVMFRNNLLTNGARSTLPHVNCTPNYADRAAGDLHLGPGNTCRVGTNLSPMFKVDIDGEARPANGAWDLGADQRQ